MEPLFWQQCRVWSPYQLPAKVSNHRQRPKSINCCGVQLYYSCEFTPSQLYPGGELSIITFSLREVPNRRSTTGYGKIIVKESYTPVVQQPIPRGADIPESVIVATLNKVFYAYLLPKILDAQPDLWSSGQPFALLAPIAFEQLCKMDDYAQRTREAKQRALNTLLKLFGDLPIREVVPERCAPIMMDAKIGEEAFYECVRVMRALYEPQFAQIVKDIKAWAHYQPKGFKRSYSVAAVTRRTFLHQPLTAWQCSEFLNRCVDNIGDPVFGTRYFAAAVLLLTAMDVAEVCALHGTSIAPVPCDKNFFYVSVSEVIQTIGKNKTLTQDGVRRQRGRQHRAERLDPASLQARKLPFCHILSELWAELRKTHPMNPDDYILHDRRNAERNLSPEEFSQWLDNAFSDIVQISDEFKLADKSIRSTYRVKDFLVVSAEMIYDKSDIPEEGVRCLLSKVPLHIDAKHYIEFQGDSALRKFDRLIDAWCEKNIAISRGKNNA